MVSQFASGISKERNENILRYQQKVQGGSQQQQSGGGNGNGSGSGSVVVGKILTEELILSKTKCASLSTIKNLNLWGSDIEDISILRQMPNAEVLSLSVNRISSLVDLRGCQNLQELYLRKNAIADIHELRHLTNLKSLKVLWLLDNPCTEVHEYRKKVIAYLPNLLKLDNTLVSPDEKAEALLILPQLQQQISNNESRTIKNDSQQRKRGKPVEEDYMQQQNYQSQQQQQHHYRSIEQEDQLDREIQQQQQTQQQWRRSNTTTTVGGLGGGITTTYSNNQSSVSYNQDTLLQHERQNQNIVCAILSLAQDLDLSSLEIIRRNVLKQIQRISN